MLIKAILGREVPSGGLPVDVGVVVNNVATAAALAEYLRTGMPLVSRVLTVTGRVACAQNVRVRLGSSFAEVVEFCGGLQGEAGRYIYGGPMTGPAGFRLDVPVTKAMSGLLVQGKDQIRTERLFSCIRCGFCLRACPYGLVPGILANYAELGQYDKAEAIGLLDCRECGSCSYACPSHRPLTQQIKEAKLAVAQKKREQQAKEKAAQAAEAKSSAAKGVERVG